MEPRQRILHDTHPDHRPCGRPQPRHVHELCAGHPCGTAPLQLHHIGTVSRCPAVPPRPPDRQPASRHGRRCRQYGICDIPPLPVCTGALPRGEPHGTEVRHHPARQLPGLTRQDHLERIRQQALLPPHRRHHIRRQVRAAPLTCKEFRGRPSADGQRRHSAHRRPEPALGRRRRQPVIRHEQDRRKVARKEVEGLRHGHGRHTCRHRGHSQPAAPDTAPFRR